MLRGIMYSKYCTVQLFLTFFFKILSQSETKQQRVQCILHLKFLDIKSSRAKTLYRADRRTHGYDISYLKASLDHRNCLQINCTESASVLRKTVKYTEWCMKQKKTGFNPTPICSCKDGEIKDDSFLKWVFRIKILRTGTLTLSKIAQIALAVAA